MLRSKTKCVVAAVCTSIIVGCGSSDGQKAADDKAGFDASLKEVIAGYPANSDLEKSLADAFRADLPQGGQDRGYEVSCKGPSAGGNEGAVRGCEYSAAVPELETSSSCEEQMRRTGSCSLTFRYTVVFKDDKSCWDAKLTQAELDPDWEPTSRDQLDGCVDAAQADGGKTEPGKGAGDAAATRDPSPAGDAGKARRFCTRVEDPQPMRVLTNEHASCAFAANVASAALAEVQRGAPTFKITARSPLLDRQVAMTCVLVSTEITCKGGNDAIVRLLSASDG